MKRLILIDAHALIHRAYHALPPLTTPTGDPINAVYGFTTILLRIIRELKPDYIAAAFDLPGPTFRHVAYERYKIQRPETPNDLASQFGKTRELLAAFGIEVFLKEGYEADDIIGTLARKVAKEKNIEVIIVTGDMDALQLVRPRVKVYSMRKGVTDTVIYDEKAVEERYGIKPDKLVDYRGLKGDPSDNIPGVKGIGEKTASELIKNFGTLEKLYAALNKGSNKISSSVKEKLRAGEKDAFLSRELSRIKTDVPVDFNLDSIIWKESTDGVRDIFQKFGFFSLVRKLDEKTPPPIPQKKAEQGSLLEISSQKGTIIEHSDSLEKFNLPAKTGAYGLILNEQELCIVVPGGKIFSLTNSTLFGHKKVQKFFSNSTFLVHDAKSFEKFFKARGIESPKIGFDIMLAAYLTGVAVRDFSYQAIVSRVLGRMVATDAREEFQHFFEVARALEEKIKEWKLGSILYDIELPVACILADLEERGIKIDVNFLQALGRSVDAKLDSLTKKIYTHAGEEFNINSSQQLSRILFEKLKILTAGLRKTEKGGVISTGASELEKLKTTHPIIKLILDYRELMKLKTTYIDVLPRLVDQKTGRLHTTFNQTGTVTGRLSSNNPNLQNIPIMSETGREIRKAFVAEKGFDLVSFDYSQIELRVAAHLADDKKMIQAFRDGADIHRLTASQIYKVPFDKVTPEERRAAKTLNFGVLYGMGPNSFAEQTGMSRDEAGNFIREYFRNFSGIQDYIVRTKRFVEEHGYVETLFGRRRSIPEIHSANWQLRREAERMAINMPIQGTATGDIVKMAMIKVDEWIKEGKLEDEVRMLLQVHDELVFEIKKASVKKYISEIKKIMENVAVLKVPLLVDVKAGASWGEQRVVN